MRIIILFKDSWRIIISLYFKILIIMRIIRTSGAFGH